MTAGAVRPLGPGDLRATARLHCEQLPVGFFPRLGPRFLRSYHATFLDGPHGIALGVEHDGRLVGFVVGSTAASAHTGWVLRHRWARLAAVGLVALLSRPPELVAFVRTRGARYARRVLRQVRRGPAAPSAAAAPTAAADAEPAVLLHVAVDGSARGHGHGAALVDAFAGAARAGGAQEVHLVTESDSPAVAFYARLGWQDAGERPAGDGRRVVEFRLPVADPAA